MVGAIALIITACGWGVSRCERPETEGILCGEVEVLIKGDSITKTEASTGKKKHRRNNKNDSVSRKKVKSHKQYRRRSPLDEPL